MSYAVMSIIQPAYELFHTHISIHDYRLSAFVTVQTGCFGFEIRRKHHLHRKALVTTLRAKKAKAFWSLGRTSNAFLTKMDALRR